MSLGNISLPAEKLAQLVPLLGGVLPPPGDSKEAEGAAPDQDASCSASCASLSEEAIDELLDSLPSAESYNAVIERRASSTSIFQDVGGNEGARSLKKSASRASFMNEITDASEDKTSKEDQATIPTLQSFFAAASHDEEHISSFPSLELPSHFHEKERDRSSKQMPLKEDEENESSRHQLENIAVSFLSREVSALPTLSDEDMLSAAKDSKKEEVLNGLPERTDISSIPHMLLFNARETFIQLLDSRLRAYTNMLLLHLTRLLATNESGQDLEMRERLIAAARNKLSSLLAIRNQITLGTSSNCFRLREPPSEMQKSVSWLDKAEGCCKVKAPIMMETTVDLHFSALNRKCESNPNEAMTVSFYANGCITGHFDPTDMSSDLLLKIDFSLDCRVLLRNMMESARSVAQYIVDRASANCDSQIGQEGDEENILSPNSSASPILSGVKRKRAVSVEESAASVEDSAVGALLDLKSDEG